MALAKRIADWQPTSNGSRPCGFCNWAITLPQEDQQALRGALTDPRITDMALTEIVKDEGYPCSVGVIGRHRRNECTTMVMLSWG